VYKTHYFSQNSNDD
jgi:DNA replication licensing factor MCM5